MLNPTFYPIPPTTVTHLETHISHVFLVGSLVYKIKKPVRLSFLDFSTVGRRRHYLEEELRLNRRLAPSVYLGVLPIMLDNSEWRLNGRTEPAEYTLVMRRLPARQMLPCLLETGRITIPMMRELAKLLAGFHARAATLRKVDAKAYLSDIEARWNENLCWLEPYVGPDEREACRLIKSFGERYLTTCGDLLVRRAEEGWVRDVHGDLHAEHICFAPEGIQIFDCIEFDARLRRCDLASEIAFLSMDLRVRDGESLVEPFLAFYQKQIGDEEMGRLLPFFECYRALVRTKVHILRSNTWSDDAARYFHLARQLAWKPLKPFLVIVCGLTGSGKSTLARTLSDRIGLAVINSDVVRKRLARISTHQLVGVNQGIYSEAMTRKTYTDMAREAETQVANGNGAILDATFMRREQREKLVRLAAKYGVPLLVVHCAAAEAIIEERIRKRTEQGTDISDGRWEIYVAQKSAAEPIDEVAPNQYLELNTGSSPGTLASQCESFLLSRLAH